MGLEQKVRAILARRDVLPALEAPYFEELLRELRARPTLPVSGAVRSLLEMRYERAAARGPR